MITYVNCQDIAKNIGISKGDSFFVSTDVGKLAFSCYDNGETFDSNFFIDSLIDAIGENGTIVFPTYN